MSVEEYEIDKAALERMLSDFEADYLRSHRVRACICYGRCSQHASE